MGSRLAPDLAGYKVYFGTSARTGTDPKSCGLCGYTTAVPVGNVTTYTVSNLVNGQVYYFSVTASDTSQNESGFSNEVSGAATSPIPAQYNLIVNVNGSGSVTKNPNKTSYGTGEQVTLTATAGSGYSFSSWSGDASGTANSVTLTMNGNKAVTANFTQIPPAQYTLAVNINGSGSVTKNPNKTSYSNGEQVTLMATAGSGYSFSSWSGDANGTTNPVTLTMNGNKTVTANFVPAGSFEVNPSGDLSATGRRGGPFDPSKQTYTLRNRSVKLVKWKVAKKPRWVTASPSNGSLAPGGVTQVIVSIGSGAKLLRPGSYSDTIVLCNAADALDSVSKSVSLTIKPAVKTYTVKTNPDGLHLMVDGVDYTSPQTFDWEVGSYHILETLSPQPGSSGTEYVFSSWSNRMPQKQTLVAPPSGATYVANFRAQYVPTEIVNSTGDGRGVNNASGLTNLSNADLPILGALESPSQGKRVFGIKTIYGWVLDGGGISRVRLLIDGEYVCDIPYGSLRGDVKRAFPDYPNAEKSGFAMVWDYSRLSPGEHLVQIEVQNVKGEVLNLRSDIMIVNLPEGMIAEINPREWLIPGINLIVDGNTEKYDLRLEWSDQSQSFEIIDLYSQ